MRSGFLLIVLIFITTVVYECAHLWRLSPGSWAVKTLVVSLFVLWMAAAFGSMMLRSSAPVSLISALYEAGHPWMIAYLYLLLAFLVADIGMLLKLVPKDWFQTNAYTFWGLLGVTAVVLLAGGVHYRHKYREELTVKTDKPLEKPLTVVFASDLHLGYSNREAELERWVDLINAENPDLVLFGGDIVDIQVRPLTEGNFARAFSRIKAPVYTILGNHEYIGGEQDSKHFLTQAGITLLRDSVARVQGITIIGRDDRSNPARKPLEALAEASDGFSILLDHQPYHLEEAQQAGIDLQLSGHTHRGQVWPLSWITDAMYEKSWGHHRRGNTQYYISSGLGIWGPKIRIGTRSEYLVAHIEPCRHAGLFN